MHTVYLKDNGLYLKKKSNRILIKKDGRIYREIRVADMKRLIIFGNNQLSTQLMNHLTRNGIEVAFLSSTGQFKFRLVPKSSKNIYLRMAQHDGYRNRSFRRRFSQTVVAAKIRNQRGLIARYQQNRPKIDLTSTLEVLRKQARHVYGKNSLEEIRGVEGYATKTYFSAFGKILLGGFEFKKRQYHPAPDPVNALLGFGYMLLFSEMDSLLEGHGFDTYLGFLHQIRYGRSSLGMDLMEELRSPIVDRLVLFLANTGAIKPDQFETKNNGSVLMNEKAKETYLRNYEKFMTARFIDKSNREPTTFRKILHGRVNELERSLLDAADYTPYIYY